MKTRDTWYGWAEIRHRSAHFCVSCKCELTRADELLNEGMCPYCGRRSFGATIAATYTQAVEHYVFSGVSLRCAWRWFYNKLTS